MRDARNGCGVDTCGEIDVTRRVHFKAISVVERFPQFVSGYCILHLSHLAFRISR